MIISLSNIKTQLGITSSTYDARINMAIPQILDQICNECRNDFVKINWSNYPVYKQGSLTITPTTITTTTDISLFTIGDFIRLYGTQYNDGLYQVKTNTEGVITIETAKTLKAETVTNGYIALIDFPNEFLSLLAKYINTSIVNDSNIKREKVPDYEVEFFQTSDSSNDLGLSKYNYILNKYRLVYKRRIL